MIENIKVNKALSGRLCNLSQGNQSLAAFFMAEGITGRPRQLIQSPARITAWVSSSA